jgi:DNA-binding MarR family transcriptional regulator
MITKRDAVPALPCLCANLRRASRALTQLYEDQMRPLGLRATQFTILQALSITGEISQGDLGDILAMDSTTLTRTLQIMKRHGWIAERRGDDRRERLVQLAKRGQHVLERALPTWESLQRQLARQLGDASWGSVMELSNKITKLVRQQGDVS